MDSPKAKICAGCSATTSTSVVAFAPAIAPDRSFALAMCAGIHQSNAVTGAKQEQCVFQDADAVVGDAVKQQYPRAIGCAALTFQPRNKIPFGARTPNASR
jgi:hypothetical protein